MDDGLKKAINALETELVDKSQGNGRHTPETVDESSLLQQLEEEKRRRAHMCGTEIQEILSEYNCVLISEVIIIGTRVVSTVRLMAK